jgi:L-aminoadipate-semialdehyde dehydrogenase
LSLCNIGKAKRLVFISSTSVLDSEHYVRLSDSILAKGGAGIPESDDMQGSRGDLPTGYGQSKWVSEQLVMEAGRRGLEGAIVRPGYIVGDSLTGGNSHACLPCCGGLPLVVNTDDFIVRLIKGCAQLGLIPEIYNTVNMVPVDHVARIVTAAAFHSVQSNLVTLHVTGHPRSRFVDILSALAEYGFKVSTTDYVPWRIALERYTIVESRDNALYPLLHFVLDNLPQSTKAPELDDRNTQSILKADEAWTGEDLSSGKGVTVDEMGIYLAYLVGIGFLEAPQGGAAARALPRVNVSQSILNNLGSVGGRGGKS